MAVLLSYHTRTLGSICVSTYKPFHRNLYLSRKQLSSFGPVILQNQDNDTTSQSNEKKILVRRKEVLVPQNYSCRHFFNVPKIGSALTAPKRKEYSERRILGYSMVQMYDIVADVGSYPEFVPWCKRADISEVRSNGFKARLEVGFPPVKERYISTIKLVRPNLVHSECSEGKLFTQLLNIWKFSPGISGNPKTCTLDFAVAFEFRSQLHSQLATVFFDEIVRTMVKSFLKRAYTVYGPESIQSQKPKVLAYVS